MSLATAAGSYPLLNIFWTMLVFFMWVAWIWLLVITFFSIVRSHDLSGFAKSMWIMFVFLIPFVGVLVYLIARGGKMHEPAERPPQRQEAAVRAYPQDPAIRPASTADQLQQLAEARDSGFISAQEFERGKARILA